MSLPKFRAWHKEFKRMYKIEAINFSKTRSGGGVILRDPQKMTKVRINNNPFSRGYGNVHHRKHYINSHVSKLEIMQFTGLTVDGVELYLSDIVKSELWGIGEIKFGEHMTSLDYYASQAYGFYVQYAGIELESLPACDIKIIGNIYENPEFLENVT